MKKKTILLTGSSGYIAKNFINLYCDKYDFLLVDKLEGIKAEELTNVDDVDFIIHLAGVSGIAECEGNLQDAIVNNVSASFNMFHLAFENDVPCIFASSQAVKLPKTSTYAFTKATCEIEALRLNKLGANIKCLRFTNIYGGEYYLQQKDSVIAKFLKSKLKEESLIINGTGEQLRDFIHVEDICIAIDLCINKNKLPYPIDIGTGEGTSIISLVRQISPNFMFTGSEKSIGVQSSIADTLPAQDLIGFKAYNRIDNYLQSF